MTERKSPWRVIRTDTSNGHTVEMRYAEFGKGRSKLRKWEFYRDGEYAGYAVIPSDAEENWNRVVNGYVLNSSTGRYELAE